MNRRRASPQKDESVHQSNPVSPFARPVPDIVLVVRKTYRCLIKTIFQHNKMSFLKKVFRNKSVEKPPSLPEAIQKLKCTEDLLLKKQSYLESKIKKEIATAKQNAKKNKKAALQAIQRKKCCERQLQKIDGTLTTIEAQRAILEEANTNVVAVSSMQKAADALKAAHKLMNADQVDEMLGDLADQKEIADEISDAICHPVGFGDHIDEEELEQELQMLGLEDEDTEKGVDKLPSVPKENIEREKSKTSNKNKKAEALAS